jgi:hypothetical protein
MLPVAHAIAGQHPASGIQDHFVPGQSFAWNLL